MSGIEPIPSNNGFLYLDSDGSVSGFGAHASVSRMIVDQPHIAAAHAASVAGTSAWTDSGEDFARITEDGEMYAGTRSALSGSRVGSACDRFAVAVRQVSPRTRCGLRGAGRAWRWGDHLFRRDGGTGVVTDPVRLGADTADFTSIELGS